MHDFTCTTRRYLVKSSGQYALEGLEVRPSGGLIDRAIADTGATGIRDMGGVMAIVKPAVQGRADVGAVSAKVKSRLQG